MLSCKEVVKIVSSDQESSWKRRLEVRFHLFICHYCRKYVLQLKYMRSGFKTLFNEKAKKPNSEEIKKIEQEVLSKIK